MPVWVFVVTFILLVGFFPRMNSYPPSWDNIPTALLPISLIHEGNFDFNEFTQGQAKQATHRTSGDVYYYFSVNSQNKVVANFPVFPGILTSPFYLLWSVIHPQLIDIRDFFSPTLWEINFVISVLLSAATASTIYVLIYSQVKKVELALLMTVIFVFATPVVNTTSRFLWQHTFSLLFVTLSLYAYLRKNFNVLFVTTILAFLCRPPTLLLCVPLLIQLLITTWPTFTKKGMNLGTVISVGLGLVLLGTQMEYAYRYLDGTNLFALQYSLQRFQGNILVGLVGLLFSPSRGLFIFSPVFLLSLVYFFSPKNIKTNISLIIGMIAFTVLTAKWDMWWGGTSLGYRLIVELVPFLILGLSLKLKEFVFNYNLSTLSVTFLIALSIIFNTQFLANFGDCEFNLKPKSIDYVSNQELTQRLWFDSPILRCLTQLQQPES